MLKYTFAVFKDFFDNFYLFQRGFMDPLDKVLSVIVLRAICMVSEDQDRDTNTEDARIHRTGS